jgi:hypothetical protein
MTSIKNSIKQAADARRCLSRAAGKEKRSSSGENLDGQTELWEVVMRRGADLVVPLIDGDWWQVAGDPDLGEFTSPKQQPVDFSIWQAADGKWQLWSCIRGTLCGGNTRLFYRWEGERLTDHDWKPMGIAMQADPNVGETTGGLQAPHVLRIGGTYHMLYGDWERICHATSADGKAFTRQLTGKGETGMFGEGPGANTRDPMLLPVGDEYYCYYTAHPGQQGAVYCRRSPDLRNWGPSKVVAAGGSAGTGFTSAECPHVVYHEEAGCYYLFRTQIYGQDAQTSVYRSEDPLDFGINDNKHLVCRLPIAAPEIATSGDQQYVAALMPDLKGIQVAPLRWAASR